MMQNHRSATLFLRDRVLELDEAALLVLLGVGAIFVEEATQITGEDLARVIKLAETIAGVLDSNGFGGLDE